MTDTKQLPAISEENPVETIDDPRLTQGMRSFLAAMEVNGTVAGSLKAAGVSRHSVNKWRSQVPGFVMLQAQAEEAAADYLVSIAIERATVGDLRPVFDKSGKPIYQRDKNGNIALDDNFEPIPMTEGVPSEKLLIEILRAKARGFNPQNNDNLRQAAAAGAAAGLAASKLMIGLVAPTGDNAKSIEDYVLEQEGPEGLARFFLASGRQADGSPK